MGDIRVDENGVAWQRCPRCGQVRIPSHNGIRRHDEFCLGLHGRCIRHGYVDRYCCVLWEAPTAGGYLRDAMRRVLI